MANRPNNVIVRQDLTSYAAGIMQDLKAAYRIATLLAPVVPTGVTNGKFNTFCNTAAFKVYADAVARRAVGGHAQEIGVMNDASDFAAQPYGLRVKIDQFERQQCNNMPLLEQSKTRLLMINCYVSYLNTIITLIRASVTAAAGLGNWKDPNIDPVAEINGRILAIWLATGIVPNSVVFDFGAWAIFFDHPKVRARMPGADLAVPDMAKLQNMFIKPGLTVDICETAMLTGGELGNTSATRKGIMQGSVYVFFNSPMPSQWDPSFCKVFSPAASLFTEIYSYEEPPHFTWFENDWTCQPQVVSSSLCARIDVTGAAG